MNTFIKKFNTAVIYMFISYIARGNFFRVSQAKTVLNHASDWSDGAFLFFKFVDILKVVLVSFMFYDLITCAWECSDFSYLNINCVLQWVKTAKNTVFENMTWQLLCSPDIFCLSPWPVCVCACLFQRLGFSMLSHPLGWCTWKLLLKLQLTHLCGTGCYLPAT